MNSVGQILAPTMRAIFYYGLFLGILFYLSEWRSLPTLPKSQTKKVNPRAEQQSRSEENQQQSQLRRDKKALLWYAKGSEFEKNEKYALALQAYHSTIEIDPSMDHAWLRIAVILNHMGRPDDALIYANRAVELNPKNWKAYAIRGRTYLEQNDFVAAKSDYTRALDLPNADRAGLLEARASAFAGAPSADLNDFDAAIQDTKESIKLKPSNPEAHCKLGLYYLQAARAQIFRQTASRFPQAQCVRNVDATDGVQ